MLMYVDFKETVPYSNNKSCSREQCDMGLCDFETGQKHDYLKVLIEA